MKPKPDTPTAEQSTEPPMQIRELQLSDGRLLLLYTFDERRPTAHAHSPQPRDE